MRLIWPASWVPVYVLKIYQYDTQSPDTQSQQPVTQSCSTLSPKATVPCWGVGSPTRWENPKPQYPVTQSRSTLSLKAAAPCNQTCRPFCYPKSQNPVAQSRMHHPVAQSCSTVSSKVAGLSITQSWMPLSPKAAALCHPKLQHPVTQSYRPICIVGKVAPSWCLHQINNLC